MPSRREFLAITAYSAAALGGVAAAAACPWLAESLVAADAKSPGQPVDGLPS